MLKKKTEFKKNTKERNEKSKKKYYEENTPARKR